MLAVDNNMSTTKEINDDYYKQAISNYTTSILLNPEFSYTYFNRAYVEAINNNITGALNDYTHCLAIDNTFSAAYYNRGLIFIYVQDLTNGCKDMSKAGELGIKEAYRVLYKYCN
jgi:lipoprotein NlpI